MARFLLPFLLLLPTIASAGTRYIVELRGTASRAQFERFRRDATAVLGKRGVEVVPRHELSRLFHGVAVTLDEASVEAVRRLPYVAAVHEDKEMYAMRAPGGASRVALKPALHATDTGHLERIGATRVWTSLGARGNGVTIAVIDSGVDRTHPAFAGRYAGGYDFINRDEEPEDPNGHGTHVAGTALGETYGVAPEARLLAYRVIAADGRGFASDTMAALERAVEEGADVINLSLGAIFGDSDEPEARAVDAAVEAGAVVVLAAGNFGGTQSIGSPATARLGIAVGNADASDRVVDYSSYGPVHPGLDLKPDVVAPGEEILSAWPGGGTRVIRGTSMASPHVAGAAALLLELHPDWTPGQVKAALIGTAEPTADEVMQRGAGRIDVHRAATAGMLALPASLSFGRMKGTDAEWTATRTVRTWGGPQPAVWSARPEATWPGIDVVIEPSTFTLAAGESRNVTVTIRARAAEMPPVSLATLSFGGAIAFTSGGSTTRLPWAFVQAASVTVATDRSTFTRWSCGPAFQGRVTDPGAPVTLLPLRDCTVVVQFQPSETHGPAVVLESRVIRADETISLGRERAKYRIHLGGVDEQGRPLRAQEGHAGLHRVDFGPLRVPSWIDVESAHPLELSEMPGDVTVTSAEMVNDLAGGRVVAVEHAPLRGVHADHTFVNATTGFARTRVRVLPAQGELRLGLMRGDTFSPTTPHVPLSGGWSGDAFLQTSTAGPVFVTNAYRSAPVLASSDEIVLGAKPLFPSVILLTRETRFGFYSEFLGPHRERHHFVSPRYEARDASGTRIAEGHVDPDLTIVDHAGPGAYTLTLRGIGVGTTTFAFDTRRADPVPPSLTSARIVNGEVVFTASEPVTSRVTHTGGETRLELTDAAGNTCTWIVAPATPSKRRTVR